MATIIRGKGIRADRSFSYPVLQEYGIDSSTVENIDPPFTMFHAVAPPGHKSSPHFHLNCCRGSLFLKGRARDFFGPEHNQQVIDIEAGDYTYTPKGEMHYGQNLSETEPLEFICVYIGVTNREQSEKRNTAPSKS